MMRDESVLRQAARLVRTNAIGWFAAAALFTVPLALVRPLSETTIAPFWQPWSSQIAGYVLRAIEVCGHVVTEGVLVVFVLRAIAGNEKKWTATWATTWNLALGRVGPALTASLAAILPMMGYMLLLFIVPLAVTRALDLEEKLGASYQIGAAVHLAGVVAFIAVLLIYLMPVAMIEGLGGFTGYRRARELLARSWGPTLKALLPVVAISEVLAALVRLGPAWAAEPGRSLIAVAALPFEAAISVLLYLRLRSDGRDVAQVFGDSVYSASITSSLPGPPAAPSPPGAPPPSDPA